MLWSLQSSLKQVYWKIHRKTKYPYLRKQRLRNKSELYQAYPPPSLSLGQTPLCTQSIFIMNIYLLSNPNINVHLHILRGLEHLFWSIPHRIKLCLINSHALLLFISLLLYINSSYTQGLKTGHFFPSAVLWTLPFLDGQIRWWLSSSLTGGRRRLWIEQETLPPRWESM